MEIDKFALQKDKYRTLDDRFKILMERGFYRTPGIMLDDVAHEIGVSRAIIFPVPLIFAMGKIIMLA